MEYKKILYTDLHAEASLASFSPGTGISEHHIIISLTDPFRPFDEQARDASEALRRAMACLPATAVMVMRRIFLSDISNQLHLLPPSVSSAACATSAVGQPPLCGTKIALWAVAQDDMAISRLSSSTIAACHGSYRHLWTTGLPSDHADPHDAAIDLLDSYQSLLAGEGCSLADNCVRTWFVVDNVDHNYAGMVRGRNEVFARSRLTPATHFIASTGIGGRPAHEPSRVGFDAYSVGGLDPGQVSYINAPSHLNPTYEYGVAFERATAIDYGDRRHVLISGTASINNKGEVVHPGDITGQTRRMLANIEALLSRAGATAADLTHGIIYLRDPSDYAVVRRLLDDLLPGLPKVIVHAPVCRPGWLIEMECSAIIPWRSAYPIL